MPKSLQRIARPIAVLIILGTFQVQAEVNNLQDDVAATERAFAKTMVDRDHRAFTSFLSDEAVFISGATLRGKQQVADAWEPYFEGPDAPFSWEPETVEVNASGTLALSSGPVRNLAGDLVATFTSIWKQEEPGVWRIVFDKGNVACPTPPPAPRPEAEKQATPVE